LFPQVYAVGDCATVAQKKLTDHLVDLFRQADLNGDGVLSFDELQTMVSKISPDYPQLLPFAHGIKKLMIKVCSVCLIVVTYLMLSF
jgi:hypothetical protein